MRIFAVFTQSPPQWKAFQQDRATLCFDMICASNLKQKDAEAAEHLTALEFSATPYFITHCDKLKRPLVAACRPGFYRLSIDSNASRRSGDGIASKNDAFERLVQDASNGRLAIVAGQSPRPSVIDKSFPIYLYQLT